MNDRDLYIDGTEMAVEKPSMPAVYKKRIIFAVLVIVLTALIFGGFKMWEVANAANRPEDGPYILATENAKSSEATEATDTYTESTEVIEVPEVTESPTEAVTEPVVEPEPTENPNLVTYYNVPLSEDLQDHIFKLCDNVDIDPVYVIAMIRRESNYKANNMGDGGDSYGLMQIQPKWHQKRMDRMGCTNLLDPYQNVAVGIDYLAELMEYGKGIEWALMAYNGGPRYANKKTANGEITKYVTRVLETVEDLEELKYYK
jgi:hypothetical protein